MTTKAPVRKTIVIPLEAPERPNVLPTPERKGLPEPIVAPIIIQPIKVPERVLVGVPLQNPGRTAERSI